MLNEALRLLRLYLGLSQKQIAKELGLSQSMISEIEGGVKPASLEILQKYSDKFNIRMSKLLFFAEELEDEPLEKRGKLIVANKVLRLLDKLAPREVVDAS
jgi:transcriptional regulator with XRE-family HTH domain